ncbi:hypothetical protein RhiXN_08093 [Rhizoctonia solani]|uniref:Uncharacterized protein n=1 Tax=Rhizoctonia solani TaxID=456999 RepID=A0A8H8P3Q2_9AGAM|nr:uncharacterized protein RhiXN_08093 [Rhizoctonia solani]QRW23057.1 hypothetical protein RhiXN_08093 [Rhizoctonia solani]
MTDSELEGPTGPRQSSCLQSPTKKIAQFDAEIGQSKGRRKNFERKQTINRKQEAYAAGLAEAGRPRLSSVPKQSLLSPPRAPPTPSNGNRTTAKGKGREELPPAIAKRGRITSPEAEEFSWLSDPRPRPKSSGNVILDGVNIEEWNRQRLLFYLSHRDNKAFNPDSNYSDLKRALGNDLEWASDTNKMGVRDQRQDQGPNMADGDSNVEIDKFDTKPPPCKPVPSAPCTGDHVDQAVCQLHSEFSVRYKPILDQATGGTQNSIAPGAAFQPQLGARDLGRALPPAQGSNLPSHSHSINYTKEPGNPLRPFELPHPPSTLVTDWLSQPGNSRPAGPWQGLEQRGPAEASNLGRPLAPTCASSVAPARAFSQAPVYGRAASQAPVNDRAPIQAQPRAFNAQAPPQNLQPQDPSCPPSSCGRSSEGQGHYCAPSQAPTWPRSLSPIHHHRARSSSRASLPPRAPSRAPAPTRTRTRTNQQPQASGCGDDLERALLTRAERKLLSRALEASRAG